MNAHPDPENGLTFYDHEGNNIGALPLRDATVEERVGQPTTINEEIVVEEPLTIVFTGWQSEIQTPEWRWLNAAAEVEVGGKRYHIGEFDIGPYPKKPFHDLYVYRISLSCQPRDFNQL